VILALGALAALVAIMVLAPLGRTNVLVLGLDRRPGEGDIARADAIMVVTADPRSPVAGLLSIPRDLYLIIPEQGENRINTAHVFAEMEEPGTGPSRTAAAVTRNFGIPIDGWVRLDFQGFVTMIDAMGGVEIDVPERIIDNAYPTEDYGTMTIDIPAGRQQMDGERALQYVRSRHSSSDFDRAERQQQLVGALLAQLSRPASWLRFPSVWRAFDDSVDKDLGFLDLLRLGLAVVRVGPGKIDHLVIDDELVTPYTTEAGAAVLAPRWELIQPKVEALFDQ
jgi:LCP family protein required for cell wall assembly